MPGQRLATYLTRLIWWSILPLIVFASWLAYQQVLALRVETEQEAGRIARNFATAIDHHLNARIGSLKLMATSPLADDPSLWPLYYKFSQGYRANFGSHVIFAEANEPMRMIFNTRAPFGTELPSLPNPKGNAAAPRAIATGQAAVGDIFVGPLAQEKLVALVVPLPRDALPAEQGAALQQALDLGIASARKITAELRPPLLDDFGLAAALDHFGKEISRTGELTCTVAIQDHDCLGDARALGLFRITQEAVANVLRHARATRIDITGQRRGDSFQLDIADDGAGFDPQAVRAGAMGLTNMQERARLLRGSCDIAPAPGGGTRVAVSLQLDKTGEKCE